VINVILQPLAGGKAFKAFKAFKTFERFKGSKVQRFNVEP